MISRQQPPPGSLPADRHKEMFVNGSVMLDERSHPPESPSGVATPPRSAVQGALTLGIVGGGQLAKMTAEAAARFGCRVAILERDAECPAAGVVWRSLAGHWDDAASLMRLASISDVLTLENEFVSADALAALEKAGSRVVPASDVMRLVQDKFVQKQTLASAGLPVPRFRAVQHASEVVSVAMRWGFPFLLKARRNAYDGKGNVTVRSFSEIASAWRRLNGQKGNPLFVEQFCRFEKELAVIVTRSARGEMACYPIVETVQRNHVCHSVQAPASVPSDILERAASLARNAVAAINGIGSFGVEMFLTGEGEVLINEMAPRVHNSGHFTIEACECSQFENHVRAVLGLPLGSTLMRAPAAVMINLLGTVQGGGAPVGLEDALRVPGAHVHLYGKLRCAPGRKMGHVTALGATVDEAFSTAKRAAACIRFTPDS